MDTTIGESTDPLSAEGQQNLRKELRELDGCSSEQSTEKLDKIKKRREEIQDLLRAPQKLQDICKAFQCKSDQVAQSKDAITSKTMVYVGSLEPGLFETLDEHDVHQIYTSFPDGHIRLESLEVGEMTAEELEEALDNGGINVGSYARSMLRNEGQFVELVNGVHRKQKEAKETLDLVKLRVSDLGYSDLNNLPTKRDILGEPGKNNGRIHELGLELCPPETGPYKRLADKDQSLGNWYEIGMEPITAFDGNPHVFGCGRHGDGLWLNDPYAFPEDHWLPDFEIVLRHRKSDS